MKIEPEVVTAYALAVFNAAKEKGMLDRIEPEALEVVRIFRGNRRLRLALEAPNVRDQDKLALIDKAFAGRVDDVLLRLMRLMLVRRRIEHLVPALEELHELILHDRGERPASVTTAVPMDERQRGELTAVLEKLTGFRLSVRWRVEPEIIGGVVARCEDLLIDHSVRTRLDRIRRRLLQTTVVSGTTESLTPTKTE
jgi:F-type H+-transporting ATPase subunit delta